MITTVMRLAVVVGYLGLGAANAWGGSAMKIAPAYEHTCALTTGGSVVCWGANGRAQLGNGTTTSWPTPTQVIGLGSGVATVAAGFFHTCALTVAGSVSCWGGNSFGQLGDGTGVDRDRPTPVSGLESGVTSIGLGYDHTCAVTTGGGVACWGDNYHGELGDGTKTNRWTPTPVSGLGSGVATIAAGGSHTCALTTGGGVVCWGANDQGQLGDGTTTDRWTPIPVSGLGSGVTAIAAGGGHTCAVTTGGGLVCWGGNLYGQLGEGTATDRWTPSPVYQMESGVTAVATGSSHTCALTSYGDVRCWGRNDKGQLGDGTTTGRWIPTAVSGTGIGVAIAAGTDHTCSLTTGGGVRCWGWNGFGQLGDGTYTNRWTPTVVSGLGGLVAPSSDFNADRRSDILWRHAARGDVWLWPMNGAAKTREMSLGTVSEPGWEIRGLGDQDGDGRANVLWRHAPSGVLYRWSLIWLNNVPFLFESYVGTVNPAYDIVGTGDYNGDGRSDILWRHLTNGELWVWLMNGATMVSATYVTTVDPGYAVVGSGDLNGDGRTDIVWRHKTGGDVWVWLMNGTTPTAMTYVTTVGDLGYQIVGVADHTGDGKADILWWHATRGEVWLWPMNGTTLVRRSLVGIVPDTGYRIVANGDYDGDGKADVLWHHVTRGEVWFWPMDGAVKRAEDLVATVPDVGYQIIKGK